MDSDGDDSEWSDYYDSGARTSYWHKLAITENNPFRVLWQPLVVLLVLYTATAFTYWLAFIEIGMSLSKSDDLEKGWTRINFVVDVLFYIDFFVYFFFTYRGNNGQQITDLRLIGLHYLRTHFVVNLFACMPSELINQMLLFLNDGASQLNKSSRIGRLQRISRLVRVARLGRFLKFAALADNPVWIWIKSLRGVRIINFIFCLLLCAHLVACGWFLCAAMHEDYESTWVYRRTVSYVRGTPLLQQEPWEQWVHSMYFVLTVFTTVGFGDMSAMTPGEVVYVMGTMLVGAIVNSIILSEVINILTSVDLPAREVAELQAVVTGFAAHTRLNTSQPELVRQLIDSVARSRGRQASFDRSQFKELIHHVDLPHALMAELVTHAFEGRLMTNRFIVRFNELPPRFAVLIALMCTVRHFDRMEVVYYSFDQSWNLFLVIKGTFANIGMPGPDGGQSGLSPNVVIAAQTAQRTRWRDSVFEKLRHGISSDSVAVTLCTSTSSSLGINALSPYQLMGVGNYFGDYELVMSGDSLRSSCVRCESEDGGCTLVLHRPHIIEIMREYPACRAVWRSAASRREANRIALLKQLRYRAGYKAFAVKTIQLYIRRRKNICQTNIKPTSSSRAFDRISKAVASHEDVFEDGHEVVPLYVRTLTHDVGCLRTDMCSLERRVNQSVVGANTALAELREAVFQALGAHTSQSGGRSKSPENPLT